MITSLPSHARAVIIGGGIMGCSIAYHLAKKGWREIVLLERKRLTSGTTWHAAGLISRLRSTASLAHIVEYSQKLYRTLETETGVATGYKECGSMSIALTDERNEELLRTSAIARIYGAEIHTITPREIGEKYPHIALKGIKAGLYLPQDAQCDPANVTLALAKGARQNGVRIYENVIANDIIKKGKNAHSVKWETADDSGEIKCDMIVNAAGMWGRSVGKMAGINVPLQACEHFYIVTEPIKNLGDLPSLRIPDECSYFKEDAGKMLIGAFEPKAKPWGVNKIPDDFEFDQLPDDFEHFEPILEKACARMPMLSTMGIHTFFNGPESFTPDNACYLGRANEMDNVWVAAGFNSIGIQAAGGAGMALAEWMDSKERPFDLSDIDVARVQPFQTNKHYLAARASESLGLLYADHYPYRQKETARGIRRSPFHAQLENHGAVFGELAGWERANWFAKDTQERCYHYSWGRQNWFENWRAEHMAVRENVAIYDMSSFGKLRVEGKDATTFLNYIGGARFDVAKNRVVYTQFLNQTGGIEADITVTRLSEFCYLVVTPAATRVADQTWMQRHCGNFNVTITDVTSSEGVLAVMGPKSRDLIRAASGDDMSNNTHPFSTARFINLGMGIARAHRISYVGALGWEIYISADMAAYGFEVLMQAGENFGVKLAGMHMMDSCRLEKGFRHFGHDITPQDHILEAGLGFTVKTHKPDFIGRDAVLRKREKGLEKRMVQFLLKESEPLLYHNEPIIRDGEAVGYLSSGSYAHALGKAIGMGYVPCSGETVEQLLSSKYEIDIAGTRVKAKAQLEAFYDPKSLKVKM